MGPLGRSHPRVNGLLCRCSGEPTCQILPQQTHPRFLHDRRGADSSPEILAPSRADFSLPLGYKIRALVTRSLLSYRHARAYLRGTPPPSCSSPPPRTATYSVNCTSIGAAEACSARVETIRGRNRRKVTGDRGNSSPNLRLRRISALRRGQPLSSSQSR